MNKFFKYPDAKQVLVSGDIHGDFRGLVFKLCVQYGLTDTLLIVAGDCGFGFEKPGYYESIYNLVAGRLKKANNWIVFVRETTIIRRILTRKWLLSSGGAACLTIPLFRLAATISSA